MYDITELWILKWIYAVGGGKLENNKLYHVALCRRNLRIYMYLDGKLVYNGCETSRFRQTSNFSVGADMILMFLLPTNGPVILTDICKTCSQRFCSLYLQLCSIKNFWKFVQKVKDVLLLLKNVCCI